MIIWTTCARDTGPRASRRFWSPIARARAQTPQVTAATREGFPVLDGVASFLRGAKCLLEHRDHIARERGAMPVLPPTALDTWREHLANCTKLR